MANIEKRGANTYRINVSDGFERNGKRIYKRKTVTIDSSLTPAQTKKELERLALEFEHKVKSGDVINSVSTFEQFTQRWISEYAEKNLEKTTIHSYVSELESKIFPAIGHIKLCDLKPIHIIKFLDQLTIDGVRLDNKKGSYSTRIIKYQHAIISSILQTAVYWQIIDDNIASKVKPPKGKEKVKAENFLDDKQAKSFIKFILETEPLNYQALACIAMYGGLRKGEILGLTWEDVDFNKCQIRINKSYARSGRSEFIKSTKNKSSNRSVTLPRFVMTLLKELSLASQSDRVLPLPYSSPTRWFTRIKNSYNARHTTQIPRDVTFHGLRHTSASLLIAEGLDIKTVSARLGHTDTATTLNIYAHAIKSRDEAASEALDKLLSVESKD